MTVNEAMEQKNISMYKLSKSSGIPYATVNDICNGKAKLEKCSAETLYKLSKTLGVSMEALLEPCFEKPCSFELFKSNVCHRLRELGDVDFIIQTLESDDILNYYHKKQYRESLYLLAMLDYISRVNQVPLCTKYDALRKSKLRDTVYPASVLAVASVTKNNALLEETRQAAIPEFLNFNIVESDVRDVV